MQNLLYSVILKKILKLLKTNCSQTKIQHSKIKDEILTSENENAFANSYSMKLLNDVSKTFSTYLLSHSFLLKHSLVAFSSREISENIILHFVFSYSPQFFRQRKKAYICIEILLLLAFSFTFLDCNKHIP